MCGGWAASPKCVLGLKEVNTRPSGRHSSGKRLNAGSSCGNHKVTQVISSETAAKPVTLLRPFKSGERQRPERELARKRRCGSVSIRRRERRAKWMHCSRVDPNGMLLNSLELHGVLSERAACGTQQIA